MPSFTIRDVMVHLPASKGEVGLVDDWPPPTPLTPHTPVISAAAYAPLLEKLRDDVRFAIQDGTIDRVIESRGYAHIVEAVGQVVVGGAVVGGGAAMPSDDCARSLHPTISPIAAGLHQAIRVSDFAVLRERLVQAVEAIDSAQAGVVVPRERVGEVSERLRGALGELEGAKGA